jgi:glycosyltransferase involved in cell wall biosynthesis
MRIALFSESYEPIINGVSVLAQALRDELCRQGHEVYVFAPAYPGFKDEYPHVFRFPSARTRFARDYPLPFPYAPQIKAAFLKLKLDIVHTQTPFTLGILGARWAREKGIPVVSTNHTLYAKYAHYAPFLPRAVTERALVILMRRYYNGCDGVASPSQPAKEALQSCGVRARIEVIPGGVTPGMTTGDPDGFKERLGVAAGDRTLLYVGRLAREKNLEMLLNAFNLALREAPDAKLVLVGAGPYEKELRSMVGELGLQDKALFAGPLRPPQLGAAYAAADVFVWPSGTETQGLAVCEALSAGKPCVVVKAGGTPEYVEDGVDSLLTQDDAESFADSTLRLLRDEALRRRMSEAAVKNSARFSVSEMTLRFVKFYESVIEEHKGGAS